MTNAFLFMGCIAMGLFGCDLNWGETPSSTTTVGPQSDKTPKSTESASAKESDSSGDGTEEKETRCMVPTPVTPPALLENKGECPTDPVFGGVTLPRGVVTFIDAPDRPVVDAELAKTDEERTRGLMYRTSLSKNAGMLFFPSGEPHVQSFWMHNTCIPLDMMFITEEGFIAGILENVPILNNDRRDVPCPTSYVLEVNAGWSRKHGVKAGQMVKLL